MKNVILFCLAMCFAQSAFATQAIVHRNSSRPTGWYWKTNQTLTQLKNYAVAKKARIIDVERIPGKTTYAAVMVKNSGTYKVNRWWIKGGTLTQIKQFLAGIKNRGISTRIIDIEPVGNGKFAVIVIENSGAHRKGWWWYVGLDANQMRAKKDQHNARIVALESYKSGSKTVYAFIMVKKSGEDNRGWSYYRNISWTTVKQKQSRNGAHIVDLDRLSNGNYNVIFETKTSKKWWWHTNRTFSQVSELVAQTKSRIVDIEPFSTSRGTRYMVVTVDNGNSLERRVRDVYSPHARGARRGFYLRQIGGSTLAKVRERTKFIPVSSIKALYHFTALSRVRSGNMNLTNSNRTLCGPDTINNTPVMPGTGSCPFSTVGCELNTTQVSLQTLLTRMMVNSNNRHTQRVRELLGQNRINQTAQDLKMTDTLVQERIGCGVNVCLDNIGRERPCSNVPNGIVIDNGYRGTPLLGNTTSLRDYGLLYEASLNFNQLGNQRGNFESFMLNNTSASSGWLRSIATQENSKVGLSPSALSTFRSRLNYAWKGGSYNSSGIDQSHYTMAGWARLPFKSGNRMLFRSYVFGVFQGGGVNAQASVTTQIAQELFREQMVKALQSWK